jgi:hypothetical protein
LKAKQHGSDDENQKAEIQKQIEAKQKEMKSKQSEVESLKLKINDLDSEQKKINKAYLSAAIVNKLENWIPYADAEAEWKIVSDDLKKAKEKSDAATVAKNQALSGAKAKFSEEQQRIKGTTADLQGAAKDEAYYEKLSQMTSHGRATLQFILLSLSNFDCFPDVKSYMGDIEARLKRLEATRQTILAQAAALSTKPTSPRIAQNPPPDKPRVRKPSVVKPRAKTPLPKPKTKPAKTKTLNFNYTGSWRSSEGSLTLTQNGNAISGQWTLPFNNRVRQISGTAQSDGSVTGTWTDEYASGTFFWKWSREFRGDQVVFRFRGEFRQNERTRRWVGIKR